jgi:hypothetical protein
MIPGSHVLQLVSYILIDIAFRVLTILYRSKTFSYLRRLVAQLMTTPVRTTPEV